MCLSILKPESKTNALALGTAGYWYYRRRFSSLCPGFESGGRDDTCLLYTSPWEYDLLVRRTLERLNQNTSNSGGMKT